MPGILLLPLFVIAVAHSLLSQEKPLHDLLQSDFTPVGCSTIQLLDESGPLKSQTVKLFRETGHFARDIVRVKVHEVKKLKTNVDGKVRLPKLLAGSYFFKGEGTDAPVVFFEINNTHQPAACSQTLRMTGATS